MAGVHSGQAYGTSQQAGNRFFYFFAHNISPFLVSETYSIHFFCTGKLWMEIYTFSQMLIYWQLESPSAIRRAHFLTCFLCCQCYLLSFPDHPHHRNLMECTAEMCCAPRGSDYRHSDLQVQSHDAAQPVPVLT